jgi:hypothetical protein
MEGQKEVQGSKSGYNRGIAAGFIAGIAMFMLTYVLLLMSR